MCPPAVNELETEAPNLDAHIHEGKTIGSELGLYGREGSVPVMAPGGHRSWCM